ncbi:TPA: hypothetical protein ACG56F_001154 [Streptococcus agalactiae]
MQHILAIISYKMTHALKCTVDLLKNDMDIVIHVDAKSDIKQYDSIKEFVTFTEERIDVRWGHYSLSYVSSFKIYEVQRKISLYFYY